MRRVIIFVYRAMPLAGQGYTWFTIDVLGFDEAFQGLLAQIGAGLALLGMWLFSDAITRRPVAQVLLWLTVITSVLSLPAFGLTLGLADWTEECSASARAPSPSSTRRRPRRSRSSA